MRDCFLDGICYQLGELHDLAELAPLAADPPLLEVYRARGLSQYAIRGTTVAESARAVQ